MKTRSRRTILDKGKWLKVEEHEVELPNGNVIPDWTWVITPDYINVVAVTVDEQFIFFRQNKYAVEGETLALIGGYIEPGEDPLAAAKREMLEETGYTAPEWLSLGRYAVDGNRGAGVANFFLATGAHKIAEANADDLEDQQLVLLSRAETQNALHNHEFKLLPWMALVSLALLRL